MKRIEREKSWRQFFVVRTTDDMRALHVTFKGVDRKIGVEDDEEKEEGEENGEENYGGGFSLHSVVALPPKWPSAPPRIFLATQLPHPNVIERNSLSRDDPFSNHPFEVCLDTLSHGTEMRVPYSGWSPAITLHGLLVQLHSTLLDPKHLTHIQKCSHDQSHRDAEAFECSVCSSLANDHDDDNDDSEKRATPCVVVDDNLLPEVVRVRLLRPRKKVHVTTAASPSPNNVHVAATATSCPNYMRGNPWSHHMHKNTPKGAATTSSSLHNAGTVPTKEIGESKQSKVSSDSPTIHASSSPSSLVDFKRTEQFAGSVKSSTGASDWRTIPIRGARKRENEKLHVSVNSTKSSMSKNASVFSNNRFDALRRRRSKEGNSTTTSNSTLTAKDLEAKIDALKHDPRARNAVRRLKKRMRALLNPSFREDQKVSEESKTQITIVESKAANRGPRATVDSKEEGARPVTIDSCVDSFGNLGWDLSAMLCMVWLDSSSIIKFGATCRFLNRVVSDNRIWFLLYRKANGGRHVQIPRDVKDWKRRYALSINHVHEDLTCFHTLAGPRDDTIGLPIDYSIHPVRKKVDHIFAPMDGVMSHTAFAQLKTRQSAWNCTVRGWIPLFIDRQHFRASLKKRVLQQAFVHLVPNEQTFEPKMALEILSKLFSTMTILIAKDGIACSERAIRGYLSFWRLLVAILEEYPQLQGDIRSRLIRFTHVRRSRHKDATPSLGELLPLLAVCPDISWKGAFSKAFMNESFDRSVLWICKEHPELADRENRRIGQGVDMNWLKRSFESRRVALKITGLHVAFASVLANSRERIENVAEKIDFFVGRAPSAIVTALKVRIRRVLEANSWDQALLALEMRPPPPEALTDMLKQSVKNSLIKKYHTEGMDFSRIHRGGTSHILLRGQTMSLGALSRVELEDNWRWSHGSSQQFLDATAMFFDFDGEHVDTLDYQRTHAFRGAARHSGDVMDNAQLSGFHRMELNLRRLPSNVQSIFVVLSSFNGAKLDDIKYPSVNFFDVRSKSVLCEYRFESRKGLENFSSVIMCRLWRPTSQSAWKVDALGHLGQGEASNYDPIIEAVQTSLLHSKKEAAATRSFVEIDESNDGDEVAKKK